MKNNYTFEMANIDKPEEIAMAVQKSMLTAMLKIIKDVKTDPNTKNAGLTWSQLEFFIIEFMNKKPEIRYQLGEM